MSVVDKKLRVMLMQQHKLNKHIHPHYWTQGFLWYRAIMIESAESILDFHDWEWWRTKKTDIESSKMEVVDIWHFLLSQFLEEKLLSGESLNDAIHDLVIVISPHVLDIGVSEKGHVEVFEEVISYVMQHKRLSLEKFVSLMAVHEMTFDELFVAYVEKSTLNLFRNDNGYRVGRYKKIWGSGSASAEDNEYLLQLKRRLDPRAPDYPTRLYDILQATYKNIVG